MDHIPRLIQELPRQVADKIAAGEVVDRPLSIVKELLENAIDAQADTIVVEIKNGGKSYIRVTDNGCGISEDQVWLAFKRHATSKIREVCDLDSIETLGFRGEALSSIAAVSKTDLMTKTADSKIGTKIQMQGGEPAECTALGCPNGTTVVVSDLFYNTPARLKFLKGDHTESTMVIDFVSKMALAYPSIRIRLINNGTTLFSTPGRGDSYANILTIYSKEIGQQLIHIADRDACDFALDGYISAPQQSKTNRKNQIFFVNGRYVESKVLSQAVTEAYAEKLFDGRYPIVFLFLTVTPDRLDVNIHPNKKQVRFDDEQAVCQFVVQSLKKGLMTEGAIAQVRGTDRKTDALFRRSNRPPQSTEQQEDIRTLLQKKRALADETWHASATVRPPAQPRRGSGIIAETPANYDAAPAHCQEVDNLVKPSSRFTEIPVTTVDNPPFDVATIHIIGTLFDTYLVGSDETNLYLIDQHAAHERIFYEQLLTEFYREEKTSQLLLLPYVVEVSYGINNDAYDWLDCLSQMGYGMEEFGLKSYIVKEIPFYMTLEESKDFLDYFLDNMEEKTDLLDPQKLNRIITKACKSAVKAHDTLGLPEIHQLMADLAQTKNPFSCPHGRPTFIRFRQYEIEKMFKRV